MRHPTFLVLLAAGLMTTACGASAGGSDATAATPNGAAPATTRPPVLATYDTLRAALADDNAAAAKTAAEAVAKAASAETPPLTAVADAAKALSQAADIAAERAAFGDLSKALIEALQGKADWREGLIAFRCPMTKTYQKWIQFARPMANPYMGKEMLECGAKVDLVP